jgi:hypothetical protein
MQVTEIPTSQSLVDGIHQISHDFFANMNGARSKCSLKVECSKGQFVAAEHVFRNHQINFDKQTATITFQCFRAQFEVGRAQARYFRLPIWNFHGALRPAQWTPQVAHPLRISNDTPASAFELFGQPGFIENVPGYNESISAQKEGDRTPRVTAVLVGETGGNGTTWEELKGWFPFDFLNIIAFASGDRVGSPWIEFFDGNGDLVQRAHVRLGTSLYQRGQEFLDDVIHRRGLGHLLTCAGNSPEFKKAYFRVAMNHLLLGIRNSQTLEDKISHLSRAIEAFAAEFDLDGQYLLEGADDWVKSRVKDVLRSASVKINEIAREQDAADKPELAASLRRVADRTISNPANVDRDFGLTVLSLLKRFEMQDAAVVQRYYESNPRDDGRQWHQVLSHYRGLSQHGEAFRFNEGGHSAVEVLRLTSHLADIVARITLKLLGYREQYQRATAKWRDAKTPDWVTTETAPIELGYGWGDD